MSGSTVTDTGVKEVLNSIALQQLDLRYFDVIKKQS